MTAYDNRTSGLAGIFTITTSINTLTGTNSPRVGGKLRLRANVVSSLRGRVTHNSWNTRSTFSPLNPGADLRGYFPGLNPAIAAAQSRCKERWNGNIRSGSASLGVTIAQYAKTRDMVTEKIQMAHSLLDADLRRANLSVHNAARRLAKEARRARVTPSQQLFRSAGSRYLEGIFGWAPLIADAQALTGSVFTKAIPPFVVSAGYTAQFSDRRKSGQRVTSIDARIRVRCQAFARVTNPNANLLSRTGVTDLAGIAWDIIPWSFVVGMFANVGAMLSDIRGFPGISITNASTTTTTTQYVTTSDTYTGQNGFSGSLSYIQVSKGRSLGLPTVGFRFKTPAANMSLAAMTVSLMAQKVGAYQRSLVKLAQSL